MPGAPLPTDSNLIGLGWAQILRLLQASQVILKSSQGCAPLPGELFLYFLHSLTVGNKVSILSPFKSLSCKIWSMPIS